MVLFISHGENNKPILFGVILVSLAFFSLKIENKKQTNRNFLKLLFASFAIALGVIILVSVLALPFVGFSGFELLAEKSFGYILLVFTAVAYPFVMKYMK